MITAWILWIDEAGNLKFEHRTGTEGYNSLEPEAWGLPATADIYLTLQSASFIQAWVEGEEVRTS